jgi:hypothetical protein
VCPVHSATQVLQGPPVGRGVYLRPRTALWDSWHLWGQSAAQSVAAYLDTEVSMELYCLPACFSVSSFLCCRTLRQQHDCIV